MYPLCHLGKSTVSFRWTFVSCSPGDIRRHVSQHDAIESTLAKSVSKVRLVATDEWAQVIIVRHLLFRLHRRPRWSRIILHSSLVNFRKRMRAFFEWHMAGIQVSIQKTRRRFCFRRLFYYRISAGERSMGQSNQSSKAREFHIIAIYSLIQVRMMCWQSLLKPVLGV